MSIMVVLDHVRSPFLKGKALEHSGELHNESGGFLYGGNRKKQEVSWAQDPSASASEGGSMVAAIVGMCGSGKTSRAHEMYIEIQSKVQFDCSAWIELSQVVNVTKVFRDMIMKLSRDTSIQIGYSEDEEVLAHQIQIMLKGKRFLIVFDSLWSSEAWARIKRALPPDSASGSRVIVTTEILQVAKDCMGSVNHVYINPLLSEQKSFMFLKYSVLNSKNRKLSTEDEDDFRDLDLDSLKKSKEEPPFDTINKVLMKCGGLKSAIVTFAELLASKPPHQWGKLCEDLPSLIYNDPRLDKIRSEMTRSYKCLPPYLRPCFLYLSIFPEDSNINFATIVNRWVAEGLVRERTGMSVKAVAEGYLSELFDRNLVKVSKLKRDRSCKACWIHPMMRDILVMIAQEEKFSVTVAKNRSYVVPAKRFRHLALDGKSDPKLFKLVDHSGIRSLSVFKEPLEPIASLLCSSQMKTLRVLDLSNAEFITLRDIRHIGELCHLRYLNLYKSSICDLPSSIGMLPFLQFINLRRTKITSLPNEITRLERLQILRASSCSHNSDGVMIPKGMEHLEHIECLDVVDVKRSTYSAIKALRKLTWLKQLGLTGITKRNSDKVSTILKNLGPSLTYLYLGACRKNGSLSWLPQSEDEMQFPCLQSIKLDGPIGRVPEWISCSITLCVVKLYRTNLQQDDTNVLDRVQSLTTLALLESSYISDKLFFYTGSFAGLKRLDLQGLPNLHVVKFMKKTLCRVREINIKVCQLSLYGTSNLNLKKLWGIRHDSGVTMVD